jgi:phenylacetate-coenzyme A ligase PaaK-like adenylate-forming protein
MIQKPYFSNEYYQRSIDALHAGLSTAPVYSSWQELDPADGVFIDDRYAALPELTKKEIREYFPLGLIPNNLNLAEGLERKEIEYVQTSGTTSEKVTNIWNQSWWNASEAASWKLNAHTANLDHLAREAQLASALSVGFRSEDDLPMQSRILNDRFLFLNEKVSAMSWTNFHYERMARELAEFQPAILEANPSLLARLTWWAIDNEIELYQPQVIIFTYEFISAMHLNYIRKIFNVPLISSFGSTEAGYIFMQCEHNTYHQNTEFCRIDFEPLKEFHSGPEIGRMLVTTFHNPWVSLIRFDTGDLVRLKKQQTCTCGRNEGYMLSSIEGRAANATFTSSGRLVTTKEIDDSLSVIDGIRDYHLEQNSESDFLLKLVIIGKESNAIDKSEQTMKLIYGKDIKVIIQIHDDIEPAASGKYKRTQTNFDFDLKEHYA